MSNDAHIFVRDIETKSVGDLKKIGVHNYAVHPSTEILCIGYCIDDEPVQIWHPGDPVPKEYREAARRQEFAAVAHNAPFEMTIERCILAKKYGFPIIPVERNVCTMAVASALALPASLDRLAKAIRLTHQKDPVGNRLMKQMAKPRKPRKNEDPNRIYWFDDPERMLKLDSYCKDDVETAREAAYRLPWLSDDEYQVWLLDQKINNRGIYIDHKLALAACEIIKAAEPHIDRELAKVTNGQVTAITQVEKLKDWLGQYIELESLDKRAIEELLTQDLPEHVLRAIELRYLGAQAASKKVDALLSHRNSTGRVYDAFVYHAAGPGRWSSRGVQLHNMKRSDTENIEKAVEVIGRGDFDAARKVYDNPLSVIGDLIRAMVVAAPGHMLIGADFSGIEARVTAWLANETSKLKIFRAFDAGTGPDPYIIAAAAVFGIDADDLNRRYLAGDVLAREQRQVGKACELAFGFQGGLHAFLKFMPGGGDSPATPVEALSFKRRGTTGQDPKRIKRVQQAGGQASTLSDEDIQRIKNVWRRKHPNTVAMWRDLGNAMWRATRHPGQRVLYRDKLAFEHDGKTLWITLPSGRKLSYPEARIRRIIIPEDSGLVIVSAKGKPALIFKDNASGQWHDVVSYGGLICENTVQAIARDLLAQAMLRIDTAGLAIVAHVHDEAIVEVTKAKVDKTLPIFRHLMMTSPDWADGLPIVAKAWSAARYVK
jgi:DNA polymerase bacteriophage-type